jgi:branched-chain amino acid transport system permease protein
VPRGEHAGAEKGDRVGARSASRWGSITERQKQGGTLIGLLLLALVYPFLDEALRLQQYNLGMSTLVPIFFFVILALGLNIVVGFAGLLDLGYAAFYVIGAYTTALLTSPQSPLYESLRATPLVNFWVALALSVVMAALFGVLLGAPTLRLRGDYLAIVTLAFGEIVPRVFLNLPEYTKGAAGINPIAYPTFFGYQFTLDPTGARWWYYLILIIGLVSIFAIVRLRDSRLGRAWMAMREDELAAASMGIDLVKTKLLAFALGASFSGFAGSAYAAYLQVVSPDQFNFSISVIVLVMVILGGLGNIWGVILGGFIIGFFDNVLVRTINDWIRAAGAASGSPALREFNLEQYKFGIFGLALVLLMLLRPEGLVPSARRKAELHPETDQVLEQEDMLYELSGESLEPMERPRS